MTTITRERLEWLSNISGRDDIEDIGGDEIRELARIALASLEAEPVYFVEIEGDQDINAGRVEGKERFDLGLLPDGINFLYANPPVINAAPPAPVVPEEKRDEDGNTTSEFDHGWNACRAALLQGSQPVSNRDELPATQQQQNAQQNIPGGLIEAVNDLLNNDGSRGRYSAIGCGNAREKIELWLSQRQKWESQRDKNISAGNSPVIPDGYALVPIVPTEGMVINGFESEPDPHFSDEKEWAEYEALSGCRRAARRAELCWAAMIKASPKMKVKENF